MATRSPAAEPTIVDYLRDLRRGWKFVLLSALVVAALAVGISARRGKTYSASSDVLVVTPPSSDTVLAEKPRDMATETELARSRQVADEADRQLGFHVFATVQRVGETAVIRFISDAGSPRQAVDAANAYAAAFVKVRSDQTVAALNTARTELENKRKALPAAPQPGGSASADSVIDAVDVAAILARESAPKVISPAVTSSARSGRSPGRDLALGFALGLVLSSGILLSRSYLNRRISDRNTLQLVAGVPVLAVLSSSRPGIGRKSPPGTPPTGVQDLRTALQVQGVGESRVAVQLTSSERIGGVMVVALELARGFVRAGRSVVVVDADLRGPTVPSLERSKADARQIPLSDPTAVDTLLALSPIVEGIRVVPVGHSVDDDTGAVLGSRRFNELVAGLRAHVDVVILVSPPMLESWDALLVGQAAEVTVFLASAGTTRVEDVVLAAERLAGAGATLIGAVLVTTPIAGLPQAQAVTGALLQPTPAAPETAAPSADRSNGPPQFVDLQPPVVGGERGHRPSA